MRITLTVTRGREQIYMGEFTSWSKAIMMLNKKKRDLRMMDKVTLELNAW